MALPKKSLTLAMIGDSKVGKSELFRYLAEQCQTEEENNTILQETIAVSVKEFKKSSDYPRCPDVVHFFRSESEEGTITVRRNHTRKYWPTVAPTFKSFLICGCTVTIYDLSGNPEFCRLAYAYEGFREVDGFVLCYDMTSKESFDHLTHWHQQFVVAREDAIRFTSHRSSVKRRNISSSVDNKDKIEPNKNEWDSTGQKSTSGHGNEGHGGGEEKNEKGKGTRSLNTSLVPFVVVGTKADYEEGRKVAHGTVAEFCDISPGTRFFETSARVPGEGAPILRVFEDLVHRCTNEGIARSTSDGEKVGGAVNNTGSESTDGKGNNNHADVLGSKMFKDDSDGAGRGGCAGDECVIS